MRRRTLAIIIAFLSCGGDFDRSKKADAVGQGAKTLGRHTAAAPNGEFRNQIVVAARAIIPAVVSLRVAQLVVSAGTPGGDASASTADPAPQPAAPEREASVEERSIGSGVVLDARGYILTTHHQIAGVDQVKVVAAGDHELNATLVAADAEKDLAVLRVKPGAAKLRPALFGNSDRLQLGEWVVSCGNAPGQRQTISAGIISALSRPHAPITDYAGLIQTDARIDAGSVGGPLVNLSGHVVGINTAAGSDGGRVTGAGFVIPINSARELLGQVLTRTKPTQDAAGLFMDDLNDDLAASFGYPGAGGALVHDVALDGPGARAGLLPGDIVIALDGRPVTSAGTLRNAIAARGRDTAFHLTIWRDGAQLATELGPAETSAARDASGSAPEAAMEGSARWGLELAAISEKQRARANVDTLEGALVTRVAPQSAADKAGVQQDDVIVSVNGMQVSEATTARTLLDEASSPVRLQIVRDGPARFVIMALGSAR